MASAWQELKRRNVVRVAIAYVIVSWLVLQLADVLSSLLQLPEWVGGFVVLLLAVGFLLALFLSWAYEVTPDGVKREKDVDRSASITHSTGRKLDFAIIGVLSVAVVIFALDKFVWTQTVTPTSASESGPTTIAVLPFVNMSDDADQEYFSDGLSEELLNLLAKIPELQVTSRTSAFSFKGKDFTIADVGRQLNVDHVLEGSVRSSGDTIRVTAQLIEVATDAHKWSDTWDRKFEDVFVIQDEIATNVVNALKVQLLDEIPKAIETTPEAYELYLQGSFFASQGNGPSNRQAEALLKQALEIDPEYVPAWLTLASNYFRSSAMGVRPASEAGPLVREATERVLQLDGDNIEAHYRLARIAQVYDHKFDEATKEFEIIRRLAPDHILAYRMAAGMASMNGDWEEVIQNVEKAHELDPLAGTKLLFARAYYKAGRLNEALQLYEERARLRPFATRSFSNWARILLQEGDYDGALALLENENADGHQVTGRVLVYQAMAYTQRAREPLEIHIALGERWTFELAEAHAWLGDHDKAFEWLHRAVDRSDQSLQSILVSPFLESIRDDPRFDEVLERLGLTAIP
jgi:TolB-like protein/Tfp pilus assembly protein PilF